MQGLIIEVIGEPARLSELPDPLHGPGDALLRVRAAPLNPADIAIAAGRMFAGHPPPPYVPGIEVVGEVVESASHAPGTLVFACLDGLGVARHGACAELAVAYDRSLIAIPPGTEPLLAAAAGTAPLAAWVALTRRAPVREGDSVVVLGATGSVGLVAVQAAKLLGAGRVVAVGRDSERLDLACSLGADAALQLQDGEGIADQLRAAAGDSGPSLIFDLLWGEPLVAALQAAAHGARVLNLGQSASPDAAIPSSLVRGKNLDLLGYTNFSVPFDVLRSSYLSLLGLLVEGRITVDATSYPLAAAEDAWRRQTAGPGAKLVICP